MTKLTLTRRTALKGIGVLGGVGTAAAGTIYYSTEGAVATASFDAANTNVTTDDGTITKVTIAPEITVGWGGFDTAPNTINVDVKAKPTNDTNLTGSRTVSDSFSTSSTTLDGSETVTMGTYNLVDPTNGPWEPSDFEASTDGTSTTRTITLDLHVKVSSSSMTVTDAIVGTTYDVTVSNQPATSSTSGSANTDVS